MDLAQSLRREEGTNGTHDAKMTAAAIWDGYMASAPEAWLSEKETDLRAHSRCVLPGCGELESLELCDRSRTMTQATAPNIPVLLYGAAIEFKAWGRNYLKNTKPTIL